MSNIEIIEVSPRDGLQITKSALVHPRAQEKLELIGLALDGRGAQGSRATSFVNPKLVPQMADADWPVGKAALPAPQGPSSSSGWY